MTPSLVCLIVIAACLGAPRADEPVRVTVAAVSGRSVFFDKGRSAGITPGLRVRLYPPGTEGIDLIIADASSSSSRVDVPDGVPLPPVGTPGELDIPAWPEPAKPVEPETPEHPPWKRQEEPRTPDQPLLSPSYGQPSKARPTAFHGRFFTQIQFSSDNNSNSDYTFARVGTRMYATNPFGHGGKAQFAGSFNNRSFDVADGPSDSESDLIIDRLSYTIGGEKYASYRAEGGRFISNFLPELGLIDGVEGAIQFENGARIGAGVGAYPEPFPDRQTGDDLGFHIFADYQSESEERLAATIGYQKTWHEGAPDRDVIIGRISVVPTKSWWLFGSAKVDVYTAGDAIKSAGAELTEAFAQARYSPDRTGGFSVSYSHFTWPELQRNEFQSLPPELIQTGRIDRGEVTAWYEIVKDLRLTGRAHAWSDQRGDGYGGGLDADLDQPFDLPGALHADVFLTEGSYAETMGFRLEARPGTGEVRGLVGYEFLRYTATGFIGGGEDWQVRHTIRGGMSIQHGRWFYNFTADRYFGDSDDAFSIGAYVEYRF